jgi:hypothetical protein
MGLLFFFEAAAFGVAAVVRRGYRAAHGDGVFIAVVFVVVEAAVNNVAKNVLVVHGFSSSSLWGSLVYRPWCIMRVVFPDWADL